MAQAPVIKEYKRPAGRPADWTTEGFLNELMHWYRVRTDYGLHKLLQVSRQTIYRYREKPGATFDEPIALKVAELLAAKGVKIAPELMLVYVARDRARFEQAREWWEKIAARLTIDVPPRVKKAAKKVGGAVLGLAIVQIALWLLGDEAPADQVLSALMALVTVKPDYMLYAVIAVALARALQAALAHRRTALGSSAAPATPQIAF